MILLFCFKNYYILALNNCTHDTFEQNTAELNLNNYINENTDENIDFISILYEETSELINDNDMELMTEELFEHLINGGDYDKYLEKLKKPQIVDNINSHEIPENEVFLNHDILHDSNIVNNCIFIDKQLTEMRDKFNQIIDESKNLFPMPHNEIFFINFKFDEFEKIKNNRKYLRERFVIHENNLLGRARNIKDLFKKEKFIDNFNIISTLDFIIEVFEYVIPRNNNLKVKIRGLQLKFLFSLDKWKIEQVFANIFLDNLINAIYQNCKISMPAKGIKEIQILKNLKSLRTNFCNFNDQKDKLCKLMRETYEIIAKYL
ncbi:uncharacterized protein VNE69_02053 [Vairimorpha necatrix]|uniref:Uncharacterized protein n=1 Tax=Vairimorpha necatrix TaxID=6039 RepID=A0AAX4J9C1_9MICR